MDTSLGRREALGFAVALVTMVPAYLLFGGPAGDLADEPAGDATAESALPAASRDAGTAAVSGARALDMREIEAHIRVTAARYGVPARLVAAIIEAESEFDPRAVSRKGARGLMQLMPATASSLAVRDAFDPYANIEAGVRHLRRLMDRFDGDLPLVVAAYNAGENAVATYGGIPPYRETRRYVKRVLRTFGRDAGRPIVPVAARRPNA
ncbi:MAG: lytic transglycosylase domain-containing protein [Candidatus Rokuibacteriota bacterium]